MLFPEPGLRMLKKFLACKRQGGRELPGRHEVNYASRIATISCVRGSTTMI
jgi:hypothetical protein